MKNKLRLSITKQDFLPQMFKKNDTEILTGKSSVEKLSYLESKMLSKAKGKLKKGKYEKALISFGRVLAVRKFKYGPGHELVDEIHKKIGDTLKLLGRGNEAEYHHFNDSKHDTFGPIRAKNQSDNIDNKRTDEESPKLMGEKLTQKEKEEQLHYLEKKLSTREVLYGKHHNFVKETHVEIANTLVELERDDEAILHYHLSNELGINPNSKIQELEKDFVKTEKQNSKHPISNPERVSTSTLRLCFPANDLNETSKQCNDGAPATTFHDRPTDSLVREEFLVTTSFISLMKDEYVS